VQHPTAATAAKIEDAATHVPFPVSLPSHPFQLTTMPPSHNSKLATLTLINLQLPEQVVHFSYTSQSVSFVTED
jgi:hypothetical protein